MVVNKIRADISEEFSSIKNSLQTHLHPYFHITQTKQFLRKQVPNRIVYKSEVLLDTLLNYLMKDAREKIEIADIELQNAFFDMDFRKRIHEWTRQMQNKLVLEPEIVQYSTDPRWKQGLIAGGVTFIAGTAITAGLAPSIVGPIVSGMATIILAALAFKLAYDKASPNAREAIKEDIDRYLESSREQVFAWLEKVAAAFDHDFHAFCSANGLILTGEVNE
ncbi:hypothetical protein [Halopseudomonas xiamenensis]|uniref:hypothetical protein n=1 Tax=Halopseudomonas xiamenensis TaxID=157792 RepID=UPI001629E97E|nr:hypothetical protein [Halopseudomonas xiamenensis]